MACVDVIVLIANEWDVFFSYLKSVSVLTSNIVNIDR